MIVDVRRMSKNGQGQRWMLYNFVQCIYMMSPYNNIAVQRTSAIKDPTIKTKPIHVQRLPGHILPYELYNKAVVIFKEAFIAGSGRYTHWRKIPQPPSDPDENYALSLARNHLLKPKSYPFD